jgi:hypothetical protein
VAESLIDSLETVSRDRTGRGRLAVDDILAKLDPKEREAFTRALYDQVRVSNGALANVMTAHGHKLSAGAVRNWRLTPENAQHVTVR